MLKVQPVFDYALCEFTKHNQHTSSASTKCFISPTARIKGISIMNTEQMTSD